MRDILFLILTVLFSFATFVARSEHNDYLMVIALYCLIGYWLLGKDSTEKMQIGSLKLWLRVKLVLITTAYLIFNYFAVMKAFTLNIQAILLASVWLFVTSGLLYLNCKKLVDSIKYSK